MISKTSSQTLNAALVAWLPVPYWVAWIAIALALYLSHVALVLGLRAEENLLIPALAGCALLADAGIAPEFVSRRFKEGFTALSDTTQDGLESILDGLERVFQWRIAGGNNGHGINFQSMLLWGIFFGIAVLVPLSLTVGSPAENPLALTLLDYALASIIVFMVGAAATRIYFLVRLIWPLEHFKLRPIFLERPAVQLVQFSHLSFECALTVAVAYMLFGIITTTWPDPWLTAPQGFAYTLIGLVVIVGAFLGPQWPLHKMMQEYKLMRIREFQTQVEAIAAGLFRDRQQVQPSRAAMTPLRELQKLNELEASLHRMHEWPFDARVLISSGSLLLSPAIVGVVQVIGGR